MRIARLNVLALLVLSTVGCSAPNTKSDFPVTNGTCMISFHAVSSDKPSTVRLGGKVFHITKTTLAWDHGGSLPLTGHWGLLELAESPKAVDINLDGVKIGEAAK